MLYTVYKSAYTTYPYSRLNIAFIQYIFHIHTMTLSCAIPVFFPVQFKTHTDFHYVTTHCVYYIYGCNHPSLICDRVIYLI